MRKLSLPILILLVSSAMPCLGGEANWPGWRGPDRTGVSSEKGLLETWPDAGPQQVWMFENCGIGFSGPAVVGDRLYIMGARNDREQLFCLDAGTTREIWSADVGEVFEIARGNGPRSTPSVDEDHVYALGANGDLVCVRARDGHRVWKASFTDLGGTTPNWGYCESVLVDGDRVIGTPGGSGGAITAFDKKSGTILWRSKAFKDEAHYASPIAMEQAGERQYVQLTKDSIVGVRASDGELLWRSEWPGETAVIPTPIHHEGQVFVTSGYGVGCKLVRLGEGHSVKDVYRNKKMKNHHGGVIFHEGHLYGYSDGLGWVCQDFATGEVVWREKKELGKGAIAYADGHFYCFEEKEGIVVLIDASPQGWKERGRFQLKKDSKFRTDRWLHWTHPVVTGGRLYLRNQELLFCFDVSKPSS